MSSRFLAFLLVLPLAGAAGPPRSPTVAAAPVPGSSASLGAVPGPLPVGSREVSIEVGSRRFEALLTYPATSAGDDAPVAPGQHPTVVFGHGYLSPVDLYASTLGHLAAAGYLVVAPRLGGELFPDHAAYAADLTLVIPWLEAQDALPDGPLSGRVQLDAIAVAGHSMGGGAAILAAAGEPRFASVVTLAAAETRPSAIGAAARIRVPTLFIGGELDAIAPVASNQQPMFEALRGGPARLRVIPGASHCGFIEPDAGPAGSLVGLVCDTASIDQSAQLATAWTLMTDWLACTLPAPGGTLETSLGSIDGCIAARG